MTTKMLTLDRENRIKVTEDTQFVVDTSSVYKNGRAYVELIFEKEGVEAEIIALFTARKGEKFVLTTVANHIARHTKCTTKVKGVLFDGGSADYTGKILIEKTAQQTNSYLDSATLVLGQNTHNKSQPILKIEADDVKASHGSSTGRVDDNQVFYLKSRGLSQIEAEAIIVSGFFEKELSGIIELNVAQKVRKSLCLI